ncbi:MAG: hypothetical protein JWO58_601 [Chitinophagaceae bacterium]|nr:hypothetical protein [Chitinophagaceae bacterium]
MHISLFRTAKLVEPSFFQKLFKQSPEENAVIEVNNLLATKSIKEISKSAIAEIEERYNISIHREFKLNLEEFYAVYLNYCLSDKFLSESELEELQHLKMILNLDDAIVTSIHKNLGKKIYKQSFEEAIADGRLSENEKSFLDKLESNLKLPEDLVKKISEESRKTFMANYVDKIISDQRLSPIEEKEMKAIAQSLNIDLQIDQKNRSTLEKLKRDWALENLPLPEIKVDLKLQKGEVCHYTDYIEWIEERRNDWTVIDRGYVYLTNKRVLFMGIDKLKNIRLDKILTCTIQMQGVKLGKETGKVPILKPNKDVDVMWKILGRLWKEF